MVEGELSLDVPRVSVRHVDLICSFFQNRTDTHGIVRYIIGEGVLIPRHGPDSPFPDVGD
ncbi:hypothetical protein PGT21_034859 [Puccinia graminis f. sp. tritici]|uniref:Uncharacterized protein n=1 Tax=Puccinia graminis f. sp. tritici TaxID=56615 RepID=A0A5B0PLB2_PUCGR|nr:hypothetical protein PGT21_034859 [Puccinia graminis f. sp. tritici]